MSSMSKRYKQIREHFGCDYFEFAEKIGHSPDLVMCIETGQGYMCKRSRAKYCELLGVSLNWLENGEGEMFLPGRENERS